MTELSIHISSRKTFGNLTMNCMVGHDDANFMEPLFFWNDFKGTIWTMKQNFKSVSWCLRWSENSQSGYSLEEGMLPLSEGNSSRYICCCLRIYLYTCVSILQYWNQNGDWILLPGRNLDAMTCILTFQKELWRRCAANNLSKSTSFTRFLFAFFFFRISNRVTSERRLFHAFSMTDV